MARFDIYTQVATATRLNREDVKKVIQAYHRMDNGKEFHIEGGNGGSYIELQQRETGMVFLEVGETCVVTVKRVISVRALAAILTWASDKGFQQIVNEYCRTAGGVANISIEQDLPVGKRDAKGTWPTQEEIDANPHEQRREEKRRKAFNVMEDALASIAGERPPKEFPKTSYDIARDALREAREALR